MEQYLQIVFDEINFYKYSNGLKILKSNSFKSLNYDMQVNIKPFYIYQYSNITNTIPNEKLIFIFSLDHFTFEISNSNFLTDYFDDKASFEKTKRILVAENFNIYQLKISHKDFKEFQTINEFKNEYIKSNKAKTILKNFCFYVNKDKLNEDFLTETSKIELNLDKNLLKMIMIKNSKNYFLQLFINFLMSI